MPGIETFQTSQGHRFRITSSTGAELVKSRGYKTPGERDAALDALIRTVAALHVVRTSPGDGDVLFLRYSWRTPIAHDFLTGFASALRAHVEHVHGRRIAVLFAPEGIAIDCVTDNDLAELGLARIRTGPTNPSIASGQEAGQEASQ